MSQITGLTTVGVPVKDQDLALGFYADMLGFEIRRDASYGAGQRWIEVAPAGAVTTIALVPATPQAPSGVDTGIRLATTDPAADHSRLLERGVDVDAEILRWPGVPPMFSVRDPDGNRLYLVGLA